MSIFEAVMVISFGAAWPASIYRSYTSRSTKGKSPVFLIIICIGYMSGILHKIFFVYDFVIVLYILNLIMVSTDLGIYVRNRKIELAAGEA
jgi:hypothetical protein